MPMVGKWPRASMAMSYLELAIFFSRSRWEAVPKRHKRHESTRQLTNLRSSKLKEWMRVWAIKILTCKRRCWNSGTEMMVQLLNNLLEVINSSFHYDIMTRIIHLSIWKGVLRKIHEPNQKRSHIHMKEYAAACNQCAELQRSGNIMQIFGVLIHTDYMLVVEPTTFVWDFFFWSYLHYMAIKLWNWITLQWSNQKQDSQ